MKYKVFATVGLAALMVSTASLIAKPEVIERPAVAQRADFGALPEPLGLPGERYFIPGFMPPGMPGLPLHASAEICAEHFALEAARRAYIAARLDLTSDQLPLWDRFEKVAQDGATKERQTCLFNLSPNHPLPSFVSRTNNFEQTLTERLDALRAARPALEALYQSLSLDQKQFLDRMPGLTPPP